MKVAALALVSAVLFAGCTEIFDRGDGGPGDAARELVDPRVYPKLVVELDYPTGAAPNARAKAVLRESIAEATGRTLENVQLLESADISSGGEKKYTLNELVTLENEHRDRRTSGDTAALYVMYVSGGYSGDSGDSRVLGVAYGGTSVAIFKGNIREGTRSGVIGGISVPTVDEECIERAVLVHEFGHAAGLVNLGAPMQRDHEDADHRGHSSNKESVMYYAVENTLDLASLFTGGCSEIPYRFDADDKADLAAMRR